MKRPYKTRWMITWPDGRREELKRDGGGFAWRTPSGQQAWSSHLDNAILGITTDGNGRVSQEPNPSYAREAEAFTADQARKGARLLGRKINDLMR